MLFKERRGNGRMMMMMMTMKRKLRTRRRPSSRAKTTSCWNCTGVFPAARSTNLDRTCGLLMAAGQKHVHTCGIITKEKKGAGGPNGRVTNRPFVSLYSLNGKEIEVGFVVRQADDYRKIIIAFTRASLAPPTYGA
jgi:hypothetical protein